jgi:hypothetical protein
VQAHPVFVKCAGSWGGFVGLRKPSPSGQPANAAKSALADFACRSYICPVNDRAKSANKERSERRLRAALRENLKRRKAQARGRAPAQEPERESHDSAGITEDKDASSEQACLARTSD